MTPPEFSAPLESTRLRPRGVTPPQARNEAGEPALPRAEAGRERYWRLFDLAPDGLLVTDADAVVREANRSAARLLGCPERGLAGRPLVLFVAPADRPVFFGELARVMRSGEGQEWLLMLRPWPESGRPPSPVSVRVGRSAGELFWVLRDESDRWQQAESARRAVADLERRLQAARDLAGPAASEAGRTLFDINPRPLCVVGLATRAVLAANDAACRAYGRPEFELRGRRVDELVHPDDRVAFLADFAPAADGRPAGGRWRHMRADGAAFHVRGVFRPFHWAGVPAALLELSEAVSGPPPAAGVLVVDDDPAVRTVLRAILAREGYRVREARDGEDALRELADGGPAGLVITDLDMPRLGGAGLIARLRPGTPVIVVSGSHDRPDGLDGVTFLPKPVGRAELCDAVRRELGHAERGRDTA